MASPSTTIDSALMEKQGAPINGSATTSTLAPPLSVVNCSIFEPIPYCDTWDAFLDKYSLATEGIGLFIVAIIGILANSLSITILAQRTMKTQISALLITLAVFDIMFLFCTFPVFTVNSANKFVGYLNQCIYPEEDPWSLLTPGMAYVYKVSLPFLYGFVHVSKVGSVFTTLAVSLERYFAVCKPLWIRIRRCHPANYIVIVTLFAFGFNITKFMEFETQTDNGVTDIYPTSIRTNMNYIVYYNFWTKTLVSELFPFVALLYLNACIFRDIRRSVKIQKNLRCTQSQKEEIKSANVVVGVVALAIFCHSWKIPPDLYEAYIKLKGESADDPECPEVGGHTTTNVIIEMFIDTGHLLVGVNSASNFFIYLILRKNFRAATKRFLTCQPAPVASNHFRHPTVITRSTNISDNGLNHSPVTDDELCSEEENGGREIIEMKKMKNRRKAGVGGSGVGGSGGRASGGPMLSHSNNKSTYSNSTTTPMSYNSHRLHAPSLKHNNRAGSMRAQNSQMLNAESAVLLNHQGASVTMSNQGKFAKHGDSELYQ
ncbi:FMRFamide receptor-like isoform X3 [Tigriopus californicus]|uniref:FMRFamide receptor-like isoform X3 n=1 Tax=Tigriopus californicus TaxID=6832 RepID=UPI0027DA243B|nr:FMRFamide receptor-like isoform X3 [Tigriopus californicus]